MTGMVVHALYTVVDRIFVGRAVNEAALGGLTLVMPLLTFFMALAVLFGLGSANLISIRLGEGRRKDAENVLNHCMVLLVGTGFVVMAVGLLFIDEILSLLGAQEGSLALTYAREYFRITLYASVFGLVAFGLSHCTRAQGFPRITMIAMLLAAGLNIILDALFILGFRWGVEGAAWATVVSQFVSGVFILSFCLSKKAAIPLNLAQFKPSLKTVGEIMSLGSPQFLMHIVMAFVQILLNTSLSRYGADTLGGAEGADIALSGMAIINSVAMLILMPVFGINHGVQPILGFNYGAKKFDRVLKAYVRAVAAATCICLIGFIAVQAFPMAIIRLFAPDGSATLFYFAPRAMRTFLLMLPLLGFQIISANMFTFTGRPKISIMLHMMRQCIVLIPCILIFGRIWGLWGVVAATPVADVFAFMFTGMMILFELRKLKRAL
jgi:putative MATE family efflux protein